MNRRDVITGPHARRGNPVGRLIHASQIEAEPPPNPPHAEHGDEAGWFHTPREKR